MSSISLQTINTVGGGVTIPNALFYRGTTGSSTSTSATFPINFTKIASTMDSYLNFTNTGLQITAASNGIYNVSFSAGASGSTALTNVSMNTNTAGPSTTNGGQNVLLDQSPGQYNKPYSVTGYMVKGEVWTLTITSSNGVYVNNLYISQLSRLAV